MVSLYREFEQVARRSDMSMAQYRTLLYLLAGSRRAGELAAAGAVTKPTVSSMLNGLRQQGWVADADDETGDGRVTRIELTAAGRARLARFEEELADRMEQLLPGVDRAATRAFLSGPACGPRRHPRGALRLRTRRLSPHLRPLARPFSVRYS